MVELLNCRQWLRAYDGSPLRQRISGSVDQNPTVFGYVVASEEGCEVGKGSMKQGLQAEEKASRNQALHVTQEASLIPGFTEEAGGWFLRLA